jgi:hypothetical protein
MTDQSVAPTVESFVAEFVQKLPTLQSPEAQTALKDFAVCWVRFKIYSETPMPKVQAVLFLTNLMKKSLDDLQRELELLARCVEEGDQAIVEEFNTLTGSEVQGSLDQNEIDERKKNELAEQKAEADKAQKAIDSITELSTAAGIEIVMPPVEVVTKAKYDPLTTKLVRQASKVGLGKFFNQEALEGPISVETTQPKVGWLTPSILDSIKSELTTFETVVLAWETSGKNVTEFKTMLTDFGIDPKSLGPLFGKVLAGANGELEQATTIEQVAEGSAAHIKDEDVALNNLANAVDKTNTYLFG